MSFFLILVPINYIYFNFYLYKLMIIWYLYWPDIMISSSDDITWWYHQFVCHIIIFVIKIDKNKTNIIYRNLGEIFFKK